MFLFILTVISSLPVHAENGKTTMADVLSESRDNAFCSELFNTEFYDQSLKEYDFSKAPFALVYFGSPFFDDAYCKPLDEILSYCNETLLPSFQYYYAVYINNAVVEVVNYNKPSDKTKSLGKVVVERNTEWLRRVFTMEAQSDFLGEIYTIEKVYCFDDFNNMDGGTIYYVTDHGNFVKHYASREADPLIFPEEEFRIYAERYNAYTKAHMYDSNGNILVGHTSFAEFYKNMDTYMQEPTNQKIPHWGYILIAAVVFLLLVFIWMLKSDKIKRKHPKT